MSLIQKINPVGVDKSINILQAFLYNHLTTVSGWTNYESYHRAYKNPLDGNVLPEVYTGTNDYEEVLFDDKFKVTSFFLVDDNTNSSINEGEAVFTRSCSIIFQGILPELYPTILHRADAEFQDDIFKGFNLSEQDVTNMSVGVDNVYSDLTFIPKLKELIKLTDMSDFHVVKFDFELVYLYNCKYDEI